MSCIACFSSPYIPFELALMIVLFRAHSVSYFLICYIHIVLCSKKICYPKSDPILTSKLRYAAAGPSCSPPLFLLSLWAVGFGWCSSPNTTLTNTESIKKRTYFLGLDSNHSMSKKSYHRHGVLLDTFPHRLMQTCMSLTNLLPLIIPYLILQSCLVNQYDLTYLMNFSQVTT